MKNFQDNKSKKKDEFKADLRKNAKAKRLEILLKDLDLEFLVSDELEALVKAAFDRFLHQKDNSNKKINYVFSRPERLNYFQKLSFDFDAFDFDEFKCELLEANYSESKAQQLIKNIESPSNFWKKYDPGILILKVLIQNINRLKEKQESEHKFEFSSAALFDDRLLCAEIKRTPDNEIFFGDKESIFLPVYYYEYALSEEEKDVLKSQDYENILKKFMDPKNKSQKIDKFTLEDFSCDTEFKMIN